MPAKITVQSGISAGTSHWIEQRVVRIGSDPAAEVCLPSASVPAHALTLEFRDGNYRVYNRCRRNVFVGTHVVAPDKAATWADTDILQLGDEIELVLDVDEDPTPTTQRAFAAEQMSAGMDEDADGEWTQQHAAADNPPISGSSSKTTSSKTWIQLAVTACCILGCVLLVAREQLKGVAPMRNRPSFATVVGDALNSPTTSRELIGRLQFAESAFVRGDGPAAIARFGRLRDDLLLQKDEFVMNERGPELAVMDFVEYRLSQLD